MPLRSSIGQAATPATIIRRVTDILSNRALNRATLARQHLLERSSIPIPDMIDHLVGMQAQNPLDPYFGLWARISDFDPLDLSGMIEERQAVRTAFLRATIHLVTSRDLLRIDPTVRPVAVRVFASTTFARAIEGIDFEELLHTGRSLLEEKPRSRADLAKLLAAIWPDRDAQSLAQAVTYNLPLVQIPPRGIWGKKGNATWATVESWLGTPIDARPAPERLALRYLAAFGPATVADMRTWSGITGLAAVVEQIRPDLQVLRDDQGRELLDLPDAPRPDPDTPAPPRFLPEYDNVLLGHSDRSRVIGPDARPPGWAGNVLYDGFLVGSWKLATSKAGPRISVSPFQALSSRAESEVAEEAAGLLEALGPGLEHHFDIKTPN